MFAEELKTLRRLGFRHLLLQILNFASVVASGLMLWKVAPWNPPSYRGDLLFLTNPPNARYHTGDITVYKVPKADIPIVHRVLETHDILVSNSTRKSKKDPFAKYAPGPNQLMLTKGDNNHVDDVELYQGLDFLERRHIIGKVRGFLPYIGYVTIAMNDFPQLKYALLGGLALLALIQRE
ncbi:hypothetical protein J3R83DRAFT_13941 [Lanmaoa asiatica]|nr:hypothetical protein J3R83DRAFT_13941 [Lanmaoa asiatica]